MDEICERKEILVVCGDVLEVYFRLNGISKDAVKQVCFHCEKAQLFVVCPYSRLREAYCLRLESGFTETIKPMITSYDLTVEFIDGNRLTAIRECVFAVLKMRNTAEREAGE